MRNTPASLHPLADTAGVRHSDTEWRNKKAVVVFFTMTDCPLSNGYIPQMNRLRAEFEARGVGFYAAHSDPAVGAEVDVAVVHALAHLVDEGQLLALHRSDQCGELVMPRRHPSAGDVAGIAVHRSPGVDQEAARFHRALLDDAPLELSDVHRGLVLPVGFQQATRRVANRVEIDDPDAVLRADARHALELVARQARAGRVVRVGDDERAGRRGDRGAEIVEVSCPHFPYALAAYYLILPSECSSNLAKFDGVRFGIRVGENDGDPSIEQVMGRTRAAGFGDETIRRIMLGTYALSAGYYDAYYGQAQKVRTLIQRDFAAAFAQADVLISPTAPTTAFKLGEKLDDPLAMYLSDIYTISTNLAGLPGISIPCGFSSSGLPIGLQLQAPTLCESRLLQAAFRYQQLTKWHEHTPK